MVRAKFWVQEVTRTQDGGTIKLAPVTDGSQENESFFRWTPGGSIVLSIVNLDAIDQFIPGKPYYVDFTPAEAAE